MRPAIVRSLCKVFAVGLMCSVALTGCKGGEGDTSIQPPSIPSQSGSGHLSIPLPEDSSLDFTLTNDDPQFGDQSGVGSPGAGGADVPTMAPGDIDGAGGIGDVGTTDLTQGEQIPGDGANGVKPGGDKDNGKTGVTPTDDNKYPNTGMFLEDD